jgi:hypothetical protein
MSDKYNYPYPQGATPYEPSALSGLFDVISSYTQPIRDASDASGNTQFWRDQAANPLMMLAAQFISRAPMRGTPAYDQAMMKVLDRRAGGAAWSGDRFQRVTPTEVRDWSNSSVPGVQPNMLPPVRNVNLAREAGVRPAQYQNFTTMIDRPVNDRAGAVSGFDRAAYNQMIAEQLRRGLINTP